MDLLVLKQNSIKVVIVTKTSRKMRLAGNVTCMGEKLNAYMVLVGKPEERDH
jgi:hypothetical protein